MIAQDPSYAEILCHCERVSRGELRDALNAPIPATNLDGLRRRTRASQGRCQGFHCLAALMKILSKEEGEFPIQIMNLARPVLDAYGITLNINNYSGVPVSIAEQQSIGILRRFMVGTIHTETAPPNYRCYMQDEIWPGERRMASGGGLDNDQLWLNPGEGLAVIGGIQGLIETSEAAFLNIEVAGYIVTPDTGGTNTYSRGRVVNA